MDDGSEFSSKTFDTVRTLDFENEIVTLRMLRCNLPGLGPARDAALVQGVEKPRRYPEFTSEDGRIDWNEMDTHLVSDLMRTVTFHCSGAFGDLDGCNDAHLASLAFHTSLFAHSGVGHGAVRECVEELRLLNRRNGLLLIEDMEPVT